MTVFAEEETNPMLSSVFKSLLLTPVMAIGLLVEQGVGDVIVPPEEPTADERPLGKEVVEKISCTAYVREDLAGKIGADLSTEAVTKSSKFGYVFRYLVVSREEVGSKVYDAKAKYVVGIKNCNRLLIGYYPQYDLPRTWIDRLK